MKQASRAWNQKFTSFLKKFGFVENESDPCVFRLTKVDDLTILAIWVDDGLLCSSSKSTMMNLLKKLDEEFKISSHDIDYFVGIQIQRNRKEKSIHLSQSQYAKRILIKYKMEECNAKCIPSDPNTNLTMFVEDESVPETTPYRQVIGSLMYLMVCTRADISYAVGQVAQFCQAPTIAHWKAVKRILSYIKGTSDYGVSFGGGESQNILTAYSDADFANDITTRKSTTGYVLMFNQGPVSWRSKRQKCVAQSTTEAEYIAVSDCTKEVVWIRRLIAGLGFLQPYPTSLFCDNQSAIKLIKNPEFHQRSKHIDIKYHYVREKFRDETITVVYVSTKDQLADIFTKPLNSTSFTTLRNYLNTMFILREGVENKQNHHGLS